MKRFINKIGRNPNFNGKETVSFDKTKVECYNCHRKGHFSRECRAPRNQGNRNGDNTRRVVPVETPANALVVTDGMGYDWSYQAEEGPTDFALMAHKRIFSPLLVHPFIKLRYMRTGKLDFEDVYFVKELKFNLFSISQVCDKKNSVRFTETKCLILSPDFKLLDESQVLLKVPRQNNMYSFNLKNVVPSGGLTCLFAKAIIDESNLWHRRLGHINFKTINKLVRGNLVRGLPSKIFENDCTCVTCQKGKQHKASCKTKIMSSISQPLQMLHMDLFGPTFVKSLNKKMYCLVVTDDFSRFSWVFFLASKDETNGILKTFITGIENQINHRVKIIRCDNGTEFKNSEMNQFCQMKEIKREFSVARTPQQNGVAERKNRTLIEAARTMLADLLLHTTFWAKAINTACYVQNRVLITKPHNKTHYELLIGKAGEGFLVGYSVNSKAFRLFDIDSLTKSMNYEPVTARNKTNDDAGIETNVNAGQAGQEKASAHEYILLPFMPSNSPLFSSTQSSEDKDTDKVPGKEDDGVSKGDDDQERTDSSTQDINTVGLRINTYSTNINTGSLNINTASPIPNDPSMPSLEETGIFDDAYDDREVGAEADLNNLETTMNVTQPVCHISDHLQPTAPRQDIDSIKPVIKGDNEN
ncbi:putative ribonuclease H-like domain-containing protein [Tanacetum coccineum]|uniref:Ribonuclease H-like domain-containing protein n=1 Tax=Tanacetum coccineum TaxID=301880 RepID=A0ABQ5CVM6_9ASTR